MAYGFNMGDLRICADVLESYISKDSKVVPYQDIRYIFGEIMYGGHITDFFDRRTNNTYLAVIFNESVVINRGDLAPGLQSPDSTAFDYNAYNNLINKSLPSESPIIYGLHPNAEVGFLTSRQKAYLKSCFVLKLDLPLAVVTPEEL